MTSDTMPSLAAGRPPTRDDGRPQAIAGAIARGACVWAPCAYLALLVVGLVAADVPNNIDRLDESYEPLKTLKFVHSRGTDFAKWGPMPNFVYAPIYAAPMAYWYATGDLARPSTDYPYGFARPFEQQGALIVLARLAGLAIGVGCMALYGRALLRFTGSAGATFLALMLFMATSPEVSFKFVATKPDGLMLAFLAASMGVYADIVRDGLTRRRGVALSVLAVASISCKELTAMVYVPAYAGLAVAGWLRAGGDGGNRRRFLGDFATTVAAGLAAYFLINVVYAPATWLERMREWLAGPGKDPAVWAPPGYSATAYLLDTYRGLLFNLGPGGMAVVAASLAIALVAPVRHRLLAWLPSVGFLILVVLTAGYMPTYFLCPLDVTLALPVAASLAHAGRRWVAPSPRAVRAAVSVALGALVLANAWQGCLARARAAFSAHRLEEDYCLRHVGKGELIHTGNLFARSPGSDRLSYLGFAVDDRPLGALMDRPARMPDVILITTEQVRWMNDFKLRPARNAMMEATGYSYDRFEGIEPLGYRLVEAVRPRAPWPLDVPWIPPDRIPNTAEVLVYRRVAAR
jgi:hypothetical protein